MNFHAWVLRKLGEVVTKVNKTSEEDELPRVEYEDIISGQGVLNRNIFEKESKKKGIEFKYGDTLFGKLRPYLKNWLLAEFSGIAVGDWWVLRSDELDSKFLYSLIQTPRYQAFANLSIGTKMPRSDWKVVSKTEFEIPKDREEQQAIGSLFKKLDDLIALQQRKIDTLKLLKKALLQQMFPEKGKDIPKVRFNCSYEKWEKHILGDYLTIPVKERIVVKNTEDLMTVKLNLGGIVPGTNRETLSLGATNYFRRHAGQLIYGKQNFFNGSIAIVPTKLDGKATSGDVPSLNISNINVDYLFSFITRKSYWKQKEVTASGTGSKRIHEKTLQKFNIEVPKTVKEQKYIGNLFGSIDIVIKFDEKIINSFKTLKQALLQNLFI